MPERTRVGHEVKRFQRHGQPELAYDEYGDPSSDPVVMLHGGAMGNRKRWAHIAPRLTTHRVLALDMRGHGDSDWADGAYRIDDYAADIEAFIERVGGGRAALVGHSWGGVVAAHVAGTRPDVVAGALFEDARLHRTAASRAAEWSARKRYDRDGFRAKVDELLDTDPTPAEILMTVGAEAAETGNDLLAMKDAFLVQRDRGRTIETMAEVLREGMATLMGRDVPEGAEAMSVHAVSGLLACDPAIFGSRDAVAAYDPERPMACPVHMMRSDPSAAPMFAGHFPPEAVEPFLATHPKATCELVEGTTHFIADEMPDRFTASLTSFLERLR